MKYFFPSRNTPITGIVQITEQSAAIGRDMQRRVAANEKRMLESLSEEDIETLTGWLTTIYDNLSRYEPE